MSNPLDMNATIVGSTVELHFPSHGEAVNALNKMRRQLDDYEQMLAGLADLPAFPQSSAIFDKGMTLRDYFAAKAMVSLALVDRESFNPIRDADVCYEVADAMLLARRKTRFRHANGGAT